jgi:hypothetical protein
LTAASAASFWYFSVTSSALGASAAASSTNFVLAVRLDLAACSSRSFSSAIACL